jgi:xanthine dehydrogenase accessory factor
VREVLRSLDDAVTRRLGCVYAAVVETRGSTPQKPGAAMLVLADGGQTGTLGGGCMEAEVRRQALRLLGEGASGPEVMTFHLDDDFGWDDGLICGGRMAILLQPFPPAEGSTTQPASYYKRVLDLVDAGSGSLEAVIVGKSAELPVGDRYLFDAQDRPLECIAAVP